MTQVQVFCRCIQNGFGKPLPAIQKSRYGECAEIYSGQTDSCVTAGIRPLKVKKDCPELLKRRRAGNPGVMRSRIESDAVGSSLQKYTVKRTKRWYNSEENVRGVL